jgi:hypothetical protein
LEKYPLRRILTEKKKETKINVKEKDKTYMKRKKSKAKIVRLFIGIWQGREIWFNRGVGGQGT